MNCAKDGCAHTGYAQEIIRLARPNISLGFYLVQERSLPGHMWS